MNLLLSFLRSTFPPLSFTSPSLLSRFLKGLLATDSPLPHISTLFKLMPHHSSKMLLLRSSKAYSSSNLKKKILSLSYWNSLLHLTVLITFSLKLFTTLVSMATHSSGWLSHISGLSFSFSFVAYPHLDWFFKCHCNS